jgi:hypothetical protein
LSSKSVAFPDFCEPCPPAWAGHLSGFHLVAPHVLDHLLRSITNALQLSHKRIIGLDRMATAQQGTGTLQ